VSLATLSVQLQACGPINKEREGPWPTDCTSPLRQLMHMHRAEIKTTFSNTKFATMNAKAKPLCF